MSNAEDNARKFDLEYNYEEVIWCDEVGNSFSNLIGRRKKRTRVRFKNVAVQYDDRRRTKAAGSTSF